MSTLTDIIDATPTDAGDAGDATRRSEIRVGSRVIRVEPLSGRKALALLNRMRRLGNHMPELFAAWAQFTRDYEANNTVVMSRAAALFEFPPRYGADPSNPDGPPIVVRPGRFDHLTDQDWDACGNTVQLPRSPSQAEQLAAVFPRAMEVAEDEVLRLLALIAMEEQEVKKHRGSPEELDAALDALAQELLDGPFEDLIELAVIGGERVDAQYVAKAEQLGDRLGNAFRLLGINRGPTSGTERPTSSTSSPAPTTGPPTPSSAPTGSSSSDSTTAST